ncbi:class I SAM-dependent methyltransferase [Sphingomonas yabuuchiae]|uniref:class I SAM-dependent methyltransferase n=1 Tax=Sphingomonas yabuuchiae TaxID=172044 RepID=UPI002351CBF3|nr:MULTISPECIES: methyltransferase domain-containing protein [Sphingomonas]
MTRERTWRGALLRQLAPKEGESILDVGCGTGSFAIMLKRAAPGARIVGLDPDPAVLAIAAAKARAAGVEIEWREGRHHIFCLILQ